jgi:hypothetical protein
MLKGIGAIWPLTNKREKTACGETRERAAAGHGLQTAGKHPSFSERMDVLRLAL